MSTTGIATRYARAIFELGREARNLEAIVRDVTTLGQAYATNDELQKALGNPLVALDAKRAIVREIAQKAGATPVATHFALLLVDRRRITALPEIARVLRRLTDREAGITRAEVTTAIRMGDDYYTKLKDRLEKLTGGPVTIETREDPAIIGGVVTRIGDLVIDGSLRTRLSEMKNSLLQA